MFKMCVNLCSFTAKILELQKSIRATVQFLSKSSLFFKLWSENCPLISKITPPLLTQKTMHIMNNVTITVAKLKRTD